MSAPTLISIANAPRTPEELKAATTRSSRVRLALQLGLLSTSESEMAFNSANEDDQTQVLLAALVAHDNGQPIAAPVDPAAQPQGDQPMQLPPPVPPPPPNGGFPAPTLGAAGPVMQQMAPTGMPMMPPPMQQAQMVPQGQPTQQPMQGMMPPMQMPSGPMQLPMMAPPMAQPQMMQQPMMGQPMMQPQQQQQQAPQGAPLGNPFAGQAPGMRPPFMQQPGAPMQAPQAAPQTMPQPITQPQQAASPGEQPIPNSIILEFMKSMKTAADANGQSILTSQGQLARVAADVELLLKIQIYYMLSGAQGATPEQVFAQLADITKQIDPRLVDGLRAAGSQAAPGKG